MASSPEGRGAGAVTGSVDAERIVLVDDSNTVTGTMLKADAHGSRTPLHRGFSVFVYRAADRQLLIQQRSIKKQTWPLMWANSCCGHQALNESNLDAARRRLKYELDLEPVWLEEVASFRYCVTREGIMENEVCAILVGLVEAEPKLNTDEVRAVRWVSWQTFLEDIKRAPDQYAEWSVEEARILTSSEPFRKLLSL